MSFVLRRLWHRRVEAADAAMLAPHLSQMFGHASIKLGWTIQLSDLSRVSQSYRLQTIQLPLQEDQRIKALSSKASNQTTWRRASTSKSRRGKGRDISNRNSLKCCDGRKLLNLFFDLSAKWTSENCVVWTAQHPSLWAVWLWSNSRETP